MAHLKKKNASPASRPTRPRWQDSKKFPNTFPEKADALQRLRIEYEDHISQLESVEPQRANAPLRLFSSEYERLSRVALDQERRTIIQLRNDGVISDEVLRRIQRDVDLAEVRLQQHQ